MEREQTTVCIQIRIPATLNAELNSMSKEAGISKNAMMLILMRLGKQLYNAEVITSLEDLRQRWRERGSAEQEQTTVYMQIPRAREPVTTHPIKAEDIGAAAMPFTHCPREIPQLVDKDHIPGIERVEGPLPTPRGAP